MTMEWQVVRLAPVAIPLFARIALWWKLRQMAGSYGYSDLPGRDPIPSKFDRGTTLRAHWHPFSKRSVMLFLRGRHSSPGCDTIRTVVGVVDFSRTPADGEYRFRYEDEAAVEAQTHDVRILSSTRLLFMGRTRDYGRYVLDRL